MLDFLSLEFAFFLYNIEEGEGGLALNLNRILKQNKWYAAKLSQLRLSSIVDDYLSLKVSVKTWSFKK